jgi:hypothetical protein
MPLSEPPLPPLAVEWTSFSFDRKITKTWRGRQVHFLLASSADIPLYHGRAKRKQEMVLIAREVSNLMSESSLDAVLVGTPHQQQFSLRNQSLVGNELLTLQMDRSGGVKQIVVVLRNRGRAKPILLDGSAQNGMLTFSEKGERRALVTNREDGRIAMSVHPNIEELHAFAILIALFFLEKGNQFVI